MKLGYSFFCECIMSIKYIIVVPSDDRVSQSLEPWSVYSERTECWGEINSK